MPQAGMLKRGCEFQTVTVPTESVVSPNVDYYCDAVILYYRYAAFYQLRRTFYQLWKLL